jgi:hypothetical protein
MMAKFSKYDPVRVVALPATCDLSLGTRPPAIGDIGLIVRTRDSRMESYTVEGIGKEARIQWLADFSPDQLQRY